MVVPLFCGEVVEGGQAGYDGLGFGREGFGDLGDVGGVLGVRGDCKGKRGGEESVEDSFLEFQGDAPCGFSNRSRLFTGADMEIAWQSEST